MMRHDLMPDAPSFATTELAVEAGPVRTAVMDALYRFGAGQDLSDRTMLSSAFLDDATLDFTQPGARFGADVVPFRGREDIVESIRANLTGIETTHGFSNERVVLRDGVAYLQALCEAQHVRQLDRATLLLKSWYWCDLMLADGLWKFRNVVIRNVWFAGTLEVLFPHA